MKQNKKDYILDEDGDKLIKKVSVVNTNNRNLNIKYNERLVKDIRKDEREKTLKEVENWIKNKTDLFYTMEFEQRWNKFKKELGEK